MNTTMNASQQSVDYRINELNQVAADLRAARVAQAAAPKHGPNPIRLAVGRAFLGLGFALTDASRQRSIPTA